MIKIELGPGPEYLYSKTVEIAADRLEEYYASSNRSQSRYNWPFNKEIDQALKPFLHRAFHGKCGYCETGIPDPQSGTVDRYRPNNGVREEKEYFEDLYWWLTFEWANLVYSCKECNQYKANYFPIKGVRAVKEGDMLENERPMLLNPLFSQPELHLSYDDRGEIYALSEEGGQTIKLLRLNRTFLTEQRVKVRAETLNWVEAIMQNGPSLAKQEADQLKKIHEEDSGDLSFLAYRKWVLQRELEDNSPLGESLALEGTEQPQQQRGRKKFVQQPPLLENDYFPIEYLSVKNFKSIAELRIDFKADELDKKSWLFLLGENGVGKSSVLQALAIGLQAAGNPDEWSIMIPSLIRTGAETAEIEIKERDSENRILTILDRQERTITQTGKFNSYLMGYGSLRLSADIVEETPEINTSRVSYINLFRPIKPLNDVTGWLGTLYRNDLPFFNRVAYSIRQLLPHDFPDNELTISEGELMFKNSGQRFTHLSDGFKSTIILAVDIMMKLSGAVSDMDKMSGVVLIDELGNQLHPRWQMRIVGQLRAVFPNINFIVSTHHPLCLRGAEENEILLLKRNEGKVCAVTELPDPAALRVDQLLASEFFGLSSLVDPEIEANFNRYYQLLASAEPLTEEQQTEIASLKDKLRDKQQLGATLREELMYAVIDKLLAQKVIYDKDPLSRAELKEEVIRRVGEVWRNLNRDTDDQY